MGRGPLTPAGAQSHQAQSRGPRAGSDRWRKTGLAAGLRPQTGPVPPPQDWDYTYVHSFYHCALAMSFTLLLPKVNKKAGSAGPPAKLDCSTLCCACI